MPSEAVATTSTDYYEDTLKPTTKSVRRGKLFELTVNAEDCYPTTPSKPFGYTAVAFNSAEDVEQAIKLNNTKIGENLINVITLKEKVEKIEAIRKRIREQKLLRNQQQEKKSESTTTTTAAATTNTAKSTSAAMTAALELKGLPAKATSDDIRNFFKGFNVDGITIKTKITVEAYVELENASQAQRALKALRSKKMGSRLLDISVASTKNHKSNNKSNNKSN
eukprot:gene12788-15004_t